MAGSSTDHARARKVRRLEADPGLAPAQAVMHMKGTSQSALRDILRGVMGDAAPSRREMVDVGQARFFSVKRTINLPLTDGSEFAWELCDPNLLVARIVEESAALQSWFADALQRKPCSEDNPWGLLIGWDENVPGNQLALQTSRKSMNLSFSFQELGPCLYSDSAWFTPVVIRSSMLGKVVGGWSRVLREYLKLHLTEPSGIKTAGLPLTLHGKLVTIYANVKVLLSDGDGLRIAFQWMGQGCLKPCLRHWNVMKKGSDRACHSSSGEYVEIDCHNPDAFRLWTHADLAMATDVIVEARRRADANEITQSRLKQIEQAYGYKASQEGLLADTTLRDTFDIVSTIRYDWMHTLLADGIVTREVWALLEVAETHGIATQEDVHNFLKEPWQHPGLKGQGRALWRIFNDYGRQANQDHSTIKCSASEMIGLYGLLRHYMETRVPPDPRLERVKLNFLLIAKVVDIFLLAKRRAMPMREASEKARAALIAHLRNHKALHGNTRVKPKTHWAFDVCETMLMDDFFMDAFIIERLHLRVKGVAQHVKDLRTYERSTLAGVTNRHAASLPDSTHVSRLVGRAVPFPGLPRASVADSAERGGLRVKIDDYVFRGESLAIVRACCEDQAELFVLVDELPLVEKLSQHSGKWRLDGGARALWRMEDINESLAWQVFPDSSEVVVIRM